MPVTFDPTQPYCDNPYERGSHPWAVRPDYDKELAKAIKAFLSKGGKIQYIKLGKMTSVNEKGELVDTRRKGRVSTNNLPPMAAYQKQVFYRLKKEGLTREEAIAGALAKKPKHKETRKDEGYTSP